MNNLYKIHDENENMSKAKANDGASTSKIKQTSLNDICYEQIKDNFYYGKFGEFTLVVDKNTGCFNATKLCTDGGKLFKNWTRLDRAKDLITFYLKENNENSGSLMGLYEIKGGNKNVISAKTTGQYVPECLLPNIIEWIKLPKSSVKEGVVYVVTTSFLQPNNLYKIGYTKNFEQRLKTFNQYRHSSEPQYFAVALYSTSNSKKLETTIHKKLRNYRDEGEFFQLDLTKIKQAFEGENCDAEKMNKVAVN
jgi:predicted GIY-YIG superfamily endonuclease